jgi:hypothetical protein
MNKTLGIITAQATLRTLSLLTVLLFISGGCAWVNTERMTPQVGANLERKDNRTIRVADVTWGKKSYFGGADFVDNEQFKKTLILALNKSGLFGAVNTDQADLDLYATIQSQDQKVSRGGLQYTATITVSYKITDRAGNVVWLKTYDSESSSMNFSGVVRGVYSREGAARENLTAFLRDIREQWPKK